MSRCVCGHLDQDHDFEVDEEGEIIACQCLAEECFCTEWRDTDPDDCGDDGLDDIVIFTNPPDREDFHSDGIGGGWVKDEPDFPEG